MVWKRKTQEQKDDETAQAMVDFVEDMNSPHLLYQTLWRFSMFNLLIWLTVLIIPNYIVKVFSILGSGKISIFLLSFPFGFGLYLAYIFFRLKIPDVEENKSLNSDFMGSMDYQSSANRRYLVWTVSILCGILNLILLGVVSFGLDCYGLYFF